MNVSITVHSYHFLDSSISSVQVKDAGHMVPMDQPRNALEMIRRWTRGISLGTQISKTIPELKTLQPSSVFSSSWLMLQLLVHYSAPQSQGPLCGPCREPHSKTKAHTILHLRLLPKLCLTQSGLHVCRQCSSMSQSTTNTKERRPCRELHMDYQLVTLQYCVEAIVPRTMTQCKVQAWRYCYWWHLTRQLIDILRTHLSLSVVRELCIGSVQKSK